MLRLLNSSKESPDAREELAPPRPRDPLASLVAGALQHDSAAEQTLLLTLGPSILSVARKVLGVYHPDIDDVCQDACVGLLAALSSFRGECTVVHFACRVTLLTALAARRRMGHQVRSDCDIEEEVAADDEERSPASILESARCRRALRDLVNELPLAQAEVLALHVILGNTIEETSAITSLPVNTVRSRLRRGLAALRERVVTRRELKELLGGKK